MFERVLIGILAPTMSSASLAADRVTLTVQKMVCDFCTSAVKRSREAVPGVVKAVVSLEDKTAIVTYDDSKVDVMALIDATTNAGYPSTPKS